MAITQLPPWILAQAVIGLAIAYTPPNSVLRPAAVAVTVALITSVQLDAMVATGRDLGSTGPLAAMGWVNVLNGIDLLLLSRVSYPAQLDWETRNKKQVPTKQLAWAFWMPYNYRRVRTPWQIRGLPSFDPRDPSYVPSRRSFLLLCAGKVGVCGLLIRLFTLDTQYPGLWDLLAILWAQRPDASLVQRMLVHVSFMIPFAILIRAVIVGVFSLMALVCVGLGVSEPALWPPISGSLVNAWSIRRLWGYVPCLSSSWYTKDSKLTQNRITWHQMLRTCLVSNVNFLISSILRIPGASTAAYILRIVLVFALSGAVHFGMDLGFLVSMERSGAMHFFVLQGFGMMFEQFVVSVWTSVFGKNRMGKAGRVVGYLWVCTFLAATAPVWLVPIIEGLYEVGERVPVPLLLGWRTMLA